MARRRLKNVELGQLVKFLRKKTRENNAPIWRAIAEMLSKPRRLVPEVNISRIQRYTREGDIVAVPGKVLGAGKIEHAVTVAAYKFSASARRKIEQVGGRCLSFYELVEEIPKGSNVKIIG